MQDKTYIFACGVAFLSISYHLVYLKFYLKISESVLNRTFGILIKKIVPSGTVRFKWFLRADFGNLRFTSYALSDLLSDLSFQYVKVFFYNFDTVYFSKIIDVIFVLLGGDKAMAEVN